MGKGNTQNFARKRKRQGHGNQYINQHCKYKKACEKTVLEVTKKKICYVDDCIPCTSAKKMKRQGNLQEIVKDGK